MDAGEEDARKQKRKNILTIASFWIFGVTNNFGYVIMLSAAHDILYGFDVEDVNTEERKALYKRECNVQGTGAILLADIMPTIAVKLIAPFLPLYIHIRIFIAVCCSTTGFILVAARVNKWVTITGVVFTALSSGLGETSFLGYMAFFKTRNVISTWSSGTGMAGVLGSFSYAALISFGLSPTSTMLTMLISPVSMALCFWLVIDHPKISKHGEETAADDSGEDHATIDDTRTVKEKVKTLPHLIAIYAAPFALVYLFEYFINQGLYELLYIPHEFLDHNSQYRWYQVLYQCGVFVSRSSMNIVKINKTWFLAFFQAANVVILLCEVLIGYMHFLIVVMLIIFWEGLVAGACYVNTYRRISTELPANEREFSMAMNSFGDSVMITLAGFIAMPSHDAICKIATPYK